MGSIIRRSRCLVILPCLVYLCCFCVGISYALEKLTTGQVMRDRETLDSPNGNFQLKFFSPDGTIKRYLGIQHNSYLTNKPTAYPWVANRENRLRDTSGFLSITQEGNMVLSDSTGPIITLFSKQTESVTTLSLLDSGNLILKAGDQIVWQSFDYPSDTLLPGMKLGLFGLKTGSPEKKFLTSWISPVVAAAGPFTLGINPNNTRELVIWRREVLYRRIGIWNGWKFNNIAYSPRFNFDFSYHSNENESYYSISNYFDIAVLTINPTGSFDMYAQPYNELLTIGNCDDNNGYFSQGCVMPEPSNCKSGDEFSQTSGMFWIGDQTLDNYSFNLSISDCKEICKKSCSCTAYTSSGYSDGTGCMFSQGQETSSTFIDRRTFYIRNSAIKDKVLVRPWKRRLLWLNINGSVVSLLVLSLLLGYLGRKYDCCFGFRGKKIRSSRGDTELLINELNVSMAAVDTLSGAHKVDLSGKKDHELPIFEFASIQVATDHFSDANKLGQGGSGPV